MNDENAGVAYTTVRRWNVGERVPDADHRERLAAAFEEHAEKLTELADALRGGAGEEGR